MKMTHTMKCMALGIRGSGLRVAISKDGLYEWICSSRGDLYCISDSDNQMYDNLSYHQLFSFKMDMVDVDEAARKKCLQMIFDRLDREKKEVKKKLKELS